MKNGSFISRRHCLWVILALSSILSCAEDPSPPKANSSRRGTPLLVAGSYVSDEASDVSDLTLSQVGNTVTGVYANGSGTLQGTLKGNTLTGTFLRTDFSPPVKGTFELTFSDDANSFTGKWQNTSTSGSGTWNGRK